MVDMAYVHGLESAKKAVMSAWDEARRTLNDLTHKHTELTYQFISSEKNSSEREDIKEKLEVTHNEWSVAYGKNIVCNELANELESLINAEYSVDEEVV